MKRLLLAVTVLCIQSASYGQSLDWGKSFVSRERVSSRSICEDVNGDILIMGTFRDTINFDSTSSTAMLTTAGADDTYIAKYTKSGHLVWVKKIGGAALDIGSSVKTDLNGNVYVSGYFYNTCDFDPGLGVQNLTSVTANVNDGFLLKLDSNGEFLWVKQIGGVATEKIYDMALDPNGFVYLAGYFGGSVDFDPNSGVSNLSSNGNADVFVLKLDTAGNFVWAKNLGGLNPDFPSALSIDRVGNIIVVGTFQATADFDPNGGVFNLTSNGNYDNFVVKLDATGNLIWAKSFGGKIEDNCVSVSVDQQLNIYLGGNFKGIQDTIDFNPGSAVNILVSKGYSNPYILKLNSNGDFIWVKSFEGSNYGQLENIALDNSSNIYSTGGFLDTMDFDPGIGVDNQICSSNSNVFISKLDSNGNFGWIKTLSRTSEAYGFVIFIDKLGDIYNTGAFYDSLDLDPGIGTNIITSAYSTSNGYFLKLSCDADVSISKSGNNLTANANNASYQWINCATKQVVGTSKSFTPLSNGSYAVIINQNSCIDTSVCEAVTNVGINDINMGIAKVYPNPTNGFINIDLLYKSGDVSFFINDVNGRILKSGELKSEHNNIDISFLQTGFYFLKVGDNLFKIVKQ